MEGQRTLEIMNTWPFWVVGGLLVVWVLFQAVLYVRLSFKEAERIGFPTSKLKTAMGNGAFAAIGPSMASIAVLIALMAVLGGPVAWHRDAVIGAPQTDLAAATIGAEAVMGAGMGLGGDNFTLEAAANAMLIMALNGAGWLIVITIFTPHLETMRIKMSGGDAVWLGLLSTGATLGVFGNFSAIRLVMGADHAIGVIVAFVVQFVLDKLGDMKNENDEFKYKWLRSYALGFSIAAGLFAAAVVGANL